MKKQRKQCKQRKLQHAVIRSFVILGIVLVIVISFVVADQYIRKAMGNYRDTAFAYTSSMAEMIDGDKIAYYLETGEKDEYYDEILSYLNAFRYHTEIQYFYVFVPDTEEIVYIWDADIRKEGETDINICELGDREAYWGESDKETIYKIYYDQEPYEELTLSNDEKYGSMASAYSAVLDSNGVPVAVVGVDMYMTNLQAGMRQFLNIVPLVIIVIILVAILLFYFFVKKRIVTPINTLSNISKSMVQNLEKDEAIEVSIHTGDEIEELFDSFKQMYSDIKDYISELSSVTAEKERIGAELDVAKHIQASMLPCIFPAFPERKEFDVYATMEPAKEVGGDFYDFFMVDETHLAIVMADVSGKGVPAALFMVIGKTLIKDHTTPDIDLGNVFTKVNHLLCESNSEELFITAFEGVLDLVTGEFVYVNAGHEMPFICKAGGEFEPQKIRAGFVLAGMEGMKYKAGAMQMEPGDKIFQYTDGVTEATNTNNELYGMERLGIILNKVKEKSPQEILPAVKQNIDAFVGEADQFDDITMLCLEYKEKMKISEEDAQ
ncbi:MAG: SpoIIE family protein phosphatase [Clostridia bacterium]|nr:SpoIIE family protein phosphatase [Bacteroidaceae bacterium]MBR6514308.1 SpoIIE family protein phosphatase [Clostridia bacterium]